MLKNLVALRELNMAYNTMSHLLISQGMFPDLEILNLSFNTIPSSQLHNLAYLPKLRELDLSSNNLTTLPITLGFLMNVEVINLSSNNFSSDSVLVDPNQIFSSIFTIPKLRTLNLSRNYFCQIHLDLVNPDECKIEEIDFSYNQIHL